MRPKARTVSSTSARPWSGDDSSCGIPTQCFAPPTSETKSRVATQTNVISQFGPQGSLRALAIWHQHTHLSVVRVDRYSAKWNISG